ncbi:MAG: translocation/assembly module TamB domain-containing protein [Bdellovibrionales bacterium]|nr:translocation/assembly module TamB domain-containing protein [Bdellovibrionales bacterium]
MGKVFLKVVAWIAGIAFTLSLILSGVLYWAVTHPQEAWAFTERHFLPADLKVTWNQFRFIPRKITWLHYNIELEVLGLKVDKVSPRIVAPIDEASATFSFSIFDPATRIDFAKVVLHADQPIVFQQDGSAAVAEPELSLFQQIKSYLDYLGLANRYASADQLDLRVKEFRLLPSSGLDSEALVVAVNAIKPGDVQNPDAARFDLAVSSKDFRASASGTLSGARMDTPEPFLKAVAEFEGFELKQGVDLSATFDDGVLHATIDGDTRYRLSQKLLKAQPKLRLRMDEQSAELNIATSVADLPGPIVRLQKLEATLISPMENGVAWSEKPSQLNISGPVDLFFVDRHMRPPLENSCKCKIPERLVAKVNGELWLRTLLASRTSGRKKAFDVRASLESVKNRLFSADLAGRMIGYKDGAVWTYEPSLDSELHIQSFQGLRNFLDAKNIMIPAPFDVLEGQIDIVAKGPVSRDEKHSETPITAKVALASEHQKIKGSADVRLALDSSLKSMDVFLKLNIDDFIVELPPLDPVAGVPKMARDPRVQVAPPPPKKPPTFKVAFFFEAKTAKPEAIRLLSKLAHPYVPISLNVQRAMSGELTGNVSVDPFDIRYLRRTVHVEQMRILLDGKESADFPVDGRFRVDQTQYRIFVDVSGTLRSPSIRLSSEPELSRPEIISVLLYDRTSDQLISSDAETAGSFEAAMADRAIGLFGLWALASTPIRSFSYNPVTKVYAATVQLADGVSAGVGTDWEEAAHFELRKRVSKRWVLTAAYSPSDTAKENVGSVVLQWEKRF